MAIETSPDIKELALALHKAQGLIVGAPKDKTNAAFKSNGKASGYASLESVIDAARPHLQSVGIAFTQAPGHIVDGAVEITTMMIHTSGQWMRSTLHVPLGKRDAQGVGSSITYGCRFSLMAALGMPPIDDDGNAGRVDDFPASRPEMPPRQAGSFTTSSGKPSPDPIFDTAKAFAKQGSEPFKRHIDALPDHEWAILKPRVKELQHIADQADAMEPAQ